MLMLMTRWDVPTTTKRNIACSAFKVKTCKFSEHFSTEWTGMECPEGNYFNRVHLNYLLLQIKLLHVI